MSSHGDKPDRGRAQGRHIPPQDARKPESTKGRTVGHEIPVPEGPQTTPDSRPGGQQTTPPIGEPIIKLPPLPVKGIRPLAYAILGLLVIYLGFELYSTTISLWEIHWAVGSIFLAIVAAVLVLGITAATSYLRGSDSLRELESIRNLAARIGYSKDKGQASLLVQELQTFYAGKPQSGLLEDAIKKLPDYSDDSEVLIHMERHFFQGLDNAAIQRVSEHSLYTGTAIALSPWAIMDASLALWRNVRMVEEISAIYGFRPGYGNRVKLLRMVIGKMAFVGGTQVLINSAAESASRLGVGIPVVAAFAQGVGAAIYTGRIGIAAIDCTRPAKFIEGEEPRVSTLIPPIIEALKKQVIMFSKPNGGTE